jgi:hypothetical protein
MKAFLSVRCLMSLFVMSSEKSLFDVERFRFVRTTAPVHRTEASSTHSLSFPPRPSYPLHFTRIGKSLTCQDPQNKLRTMPVPPQGERPQTKGEGVHTVLVVSYVASYDVSTNQWWKTSDSSTDREEQKTDTDRRVVTGFTRRTMLMSLI